MSRNYLLIVHPDSSIRALMASMLRTLGHRIEEAECDSAAVRIMNTSPPALILAGVDPNHDDALELLDYMRRKHSRVPTILLFPEAHPDRAREAMKRGAASVLRYPAAANSLRAAVSQALEEQGRNGEISSFSLPRSRGFDNPAGMNGSSTHNGHAASENGSEGTHDGPPTPPIHGRPSALSDLISFVGHDPAFRQALEFASSIASSRAPVLIVGERGTGKTLFARFLHGQGPRRDGPLIEVACGALGEAAMEAELFGQAGSHLPDRPGKIAQARGGTLYLDEVASLSPALQLRILQWIQDGEFLPIGGVRPIRSDVRLIVSSREDLASLADEGSFRQDLYHRISVITLKIPPLRHRGSDMELLADHFRNKFGREVGKALAGFTTEAAEAMRAYNWPGNVLELENAVERGVVLCRGGQIEAGHLALPRRSSLSQSHERNSSSSNAPNSSTGILPLKEALEAPERLLILQALEALSWNRQETARVLDINRTTLYKKMKKYGLLVEEPAWVH